MAGTQEQSRAEFRAFVIERVLQEQIHLADLDRQLLRLHHSFRRAGLGPNDADAGQAHRDPARGLDGGGV